MKKMNMGGMAEHMQKEHGIKPANKAKGFNKGGATKCMKKGGPTGLEMRKVGRNMARANNQRGR
jgi:hypothetical protein|tara:strand:+ start:621 stop:812 length:192 start_codon:yes stop_codon:yes gene_type:complete